MISKLRTLLVLGRASNLPTVWSNCLAGWLLGGGGEWPRFAVLCAGATLLYTGGMFLNDAFDAEFDAQHRRERPVPSGAIALGLVWKLGLAMLVTGTVLVGWLGFTTALLAVLLAGSILLYDWLHKLVAFSPALMAVCRFLLYLAASSAAMRGVTDLAVWSAVTLAAYIMGLSYLARKEATGLTIRKWPQLLLLIPPTIALLLHDGSSRESALLVSVIFALWTIRSLRHVWMVPRLVPRAVSGLLAGIVWVDWLAVADESKVFGVIFIGLFLAALLFQRFVPAT